MNNVSLHPWFFQYTTGTRVSLGLCTIELVSEATLAESGSRCASRGFIQQSTETMKTVEWSISSIEVTTRALIDELALKPREALLALRVAVSGGDVSPPLFESMYLVGRERTVARLARWI